MNLIGITPYDRKNYDREMENVLKKRLLGIDKFAKTVPKNAMVSHTGSPIKVTNGMVQYTDDQRLNFVLNNLSNNNLQDDSGKGDVSGFAQNANVKGAFSVPQNMAGDTLISLLTEDELEIIIQFEEENSRLGNFERIYPLNSKAAHYLKFYEH